MRHKLLMPEPAIPVLRGLAVRIGLNQAIVVQQLHFRGLATNDGWVERRFETWHEVDFPFWSERTVRRTFDALLELRIVERAESEYRWRLRYEAMPEYVLPGTDCQEQRQIGLAHEEALKEKKRENPPKTPRKRGAPVAPQDEPIGFGEWVGYHAEHTGRSVPRAMTDTRSKLARTFGDLLAQGYELDDFKAVTDLMRLDPWWVARPDARKFATALRKGEFGERVDAGRRLRAVEAESAGRESKAELFERLNAEAQARQQEAA